jgi:RNA polymerase sigma-70 factor (ECF subfamily)
VRALLKKLPSHYREILLLRYVEDQSYEEIGDILKKPAGTVATQINRAKNELKSLLTKYYESHE